MDIVNEIIYKKISEIKPYVRNGRYNARTVELLEKIIPKVGFNVPIVIDEKGIIVKGHARYIAAIRLGMEEVPCVVTHASEDDVKLNRIADNMVSEFSEWLTDSLLEELKNLDIDFNMNELDLPDFNFIEEEQETIEPEEYSSRKEEMDVLAEKLNQKGYYYMVVCPDCGQKSFIKTDEAEDV